MTAVLLPNGKQQFFTTPGVPAVGYKLMTWAAGTSTPQTTWADALKIGANPNPIILDARGEAVIFWDGAYKIQLQDASGAPVWAPVDNVSSLPSFSASLIPTADNSFTLGSAAFSWENLYLGPGDAVAYDSVSGNIAYFKRTDAEIAAGVTPIAFGYPPGDIRRFCLLNGTDETAGVQNWAKVGGNLSFPVAQSVLITAPVPLVSNTTITAVDGAIIQTATPDISLFTAASKNHISILNLHFKQTVALAATSIAGVFLDACSDCVIEECEFEGMQFAGIFAQAVQRCTFRGNYFHDPLLGTGTRQNSADIYLASSPTTGANNNVIDGNFCYGSLFEFGVAVWDPYAGALPINNIVINNRIGAHQGYGILIYMPDAGDSYNQIIGNHVQDISAHSTNTDSGAGIYLAGAGMGGTQVIGNTVQNCCTTTSTTSLAPAGIGVNAAGLTLGTMPIVIANNIIDGMTKYYGILLTGVLGGASVTGNTIRQPAGNTTGDALRVVNSDNVTVANNTILQANSTTNQECIVFAALGVNCTNCACVGNTIRGGHHSQIRCLQSGGFQVQELTITGNVCSGGDGSCVPLILDTAAAADVMVASNVFSSGASAAVQQNACTSVRYTGNRLRSTGATVFATTGANTSSYFDKTNTGVGIGVGISNGGTLLLIEQHGAAAPAAGLWAVGDRIEQSVPVVGNPKGWRCTVAGTPGTFVSEGNL